MSIRKCSGHEGHIGIAHAYPVRVHQAYGDVLGKKAVSRCVICFVQIWHVKCRDDSAMKTMLSALNNLPD